MRDWWATVWRLTLASVWPHTVHVQILHHVTASGRHHHDNESKNILIGVGLRSRPSCRAPETLINHWSITGMWTDQCCRVHTVWTEHWVQSWGSRPRCGSLLLMSEHVTAVHVSDVDINYFYFLNIVEHNCFQNLFVVIQIIHRHRYECSACP